MFHQHKAHSLWSTQPLAFVSALNWSLELRQDLRLYREERRSEKNGRGTAAAKKQTNGMKYKPSDVLKRRSHITQDWCMERIAFRAVDEALANLMRCDWAAEINAGDKWLLSTPKGIGGNSRGMHAMTSSDNSGG